MSWRYSSEMPPGISVRCMRKAVLSARTPGDGAQRSLCMKARKGERAKARNRQSTTKTRRHKEHKEDEGTIGKAVRIAHSLVFLFAFFVFFVSLWLVCSSFRAFALS